jgi:hypothetical protein
MTVQPRGKSQAIGLGGGVHTTTGGYTVINYRLVADRIRELRDARRPVPDYLQRMLQTLQPEAAFVMLTLSPHGHEDAPFSPPQQAIAQEMIDTQEAARRLGCSVRTVRRKAHELGGRQVASRWVFDRSTILAATAERRTTAA